MGKQKTEDELWLIHPDIPVIELENIDNSAPQAIEKVMPEEPGLLPEDHNTWKWPRFVREQKEPGQGTGYSERGK